MITLNVVLGLIAIYFGTKYFLYWEMERKVNILTLFSKEKKKDRITFKSPEDIIDRELNAIRGTVLIIAGAVAFFVGLSK